MTEVMASSADLGKRFDAVTPIVDLVNGGHFHLAYWYDDQDPASLNEAGQRITRKVAAALGLKPGERLLDAGCGPGGPATLIAAETGARVTGVSISGYDIAEGNQRAKSADMEDQVTFQLGDYMSLSFADGSFDAVMAIESLLCAPDLDQALQEFFRVLKPGGEIALAHCTKEAEMSPELMDQFKASTMANSLPTLTEWLSALERAGFQVEEYSQMGPRVFGQSSKYFEAIDEQYDDLVTKVTPETIAGFKHGMQGFFTPGPEHVGYAIVAGRKPAV